MSDEGEKTCPLCAEEMDLTDQQLKPCKCGYEICVWCWHHIMEMAEKDETEGRCPACRTPYDKERIVGTAAKCERLVAEVSMEKKYKSQKAKTKTSESRKQLSTVRVIQRNLVYIVGLPLNLADEDLLQRRDYFGQYGKVLKVSISRTSAGTIQQFANNTCSVYITYGKEEEAVRCIQSVHGFILDGRPLRACFGTTKYCHAWLRNVPCSNPDCLYLHEIGSQEDSFTKDEIISAYTRSRVQQITGFTNNMQRRSGNALPPPSDDYSDNSSAVMGKPVPKNTLNNPTNNTRSTPPTSSSGRSGALPVAASWGARPSTCSQPAASVPCTNGPTKQKAEVVSQSPALPTVSSGSTQESILTTDGVKKFVFNEETSAKPSKHKMEMLDTLKQDLGASPLTNVSEVSTPLGTPSTKSTSQPSVLPAAENKAEHKSGDGVPINSELSADQQSSSMDMDKAVSSIAEEHIQNLDSGISSLNISDHLPGEHSETARPNVLSLDNFLSPGSQGLRQDPDKDREHSASSAFSAPAGSLEPVSASSELCGWRSDAKPPNLQNQTYETEDDFDSQRLKDAVIVSNTTIPTSSPLHLLNHLRGPSQQHAATAVNYTVNSPIVHRVHDEGLVANHSGVSVASNGFIEEFGSHGSVQGNSYLFKNAEQGNQTIGRFDAGLVNGDSQPTLDMGESSIISNILDLDSWDASLTCPTDLVKLLGNTEKQEVPVKLANSWKGQINNQSRFSFASQEEPRNHLFDFASSLGNSGQAVTNQSFGQAFGENQDPVSDRLCSSFGFAHRNIEPSENLTSGPFGFPSKQSSLVSRSHISAPPGFSAPSRPPPPGFSSYERSDQTYEMKSGNHFLETSSLLRNPYEASAGGNINTVNDIEFIDPAILAVGKGRLPSGTTNSSIDMRPNFHVQTPAFENESRLHFLLQRSLSPHQSYRYSNVNDSFAPPNDIRGFPSQHMEQSQSSSFAPFSQFPVQQARNNIVSNGHWDGWSEIQSANDMGMAELLRGDGLGFNKFRMTNSGDLYKNGFRM